MAKHWMLRGPGPVMIVFGVVFGGLYWIATRSDWGPVKRVKPAYAQKVEVAPQKPFELDWPARREDPKAPPLSLLVPIADFTQWRSEDKFVMERRPGRGQRLDFFVMFPDAGSLSTTALGNQCDAQYEADNCYVEELRVQLMEDAPGRDDIGREVMDSKARGSSDTATSGPPRKLKAFWVKDIRETGRLEFVGWDCPDEKPTGAASTDPATPLLERNRCFEPASVEEKRAPATAGYQRFVRLLACSGNGRDCKIYFPFRGRYVEVTPDDASRLIAKREEENGYLFLVAWEFLNRLHGDTRKPPPAAVRLARGETALENCRMVQGWTKEIQRLGTTQRRDTLGRYIRSQCGLAAYYALVTMEQSPVEAAQLLAASVTSSPFNSKRAAAHLQTAIDALDKAGKGGSQAMAQAKMALAASYGYGDASSAEGRAKRAALKEALGIADAALPPGSDMHAAIYRELSRVMTVEKEPEKVELMERWQASMRQAHGDADPRAIEAMQGFCFALHGARQQERLKDCADALLPRWLAATSVQLDSKFPDALLAQGTALIGWYAGYGLSQNKPLEVLPTMRQIAAIVQPRIPPDVWATYTAPSIKYVEDRARLAPRK